MDLDLRLVRYFVAVADELHFGRAAARLHISQPALSKQVRKLEDDLGAPLLVRDSRHVSLTPYGRQFLEDGRRLLAIAERMTHPSSTHARADRAHLRAGHQLVRGRGVLPRASRCPLIERPMDSIRQLKAMLSGRLDVAILRVTRQMLADHPAGWHHRLLRLEPMVLVGRPGDDPPRRRLVARAPDRSVRRPAPLRRPTTPTASTCPPSNMTRAPLSWLGTPGTFANCLAHVNRASAPHRHLEFLSYAAEVRPGRYADALAGRSSSRTTRGPWPGGTTTTR